MEPSNLGTIAITGASGQVGRALLGRLKFLRARTVALTRKPVKLPASEVIAGSLDSRAALTAMAKASYVVHLAGTLYPTGKNSLHEANAETADAVANALTISNARRVLFLSYLDASEESDNEYLRLKARAERLLRQTSRELVVFRCSHIIGPPEAPGPTATALMAKEGKPVRVLGDGLQVVAPVYIGDVVSALAAAIARGSPGTYDLTGPGRMTMDDLVRLVNGDPSVPITHCPARFARFLSRFFPALPAPFVDVMLRDSIGDASHGVSEFGLTLTPLETVWGERKRPIAAGDRDIACACGEAAGMRSGA